METAPLIWIGTEDSVCIICIGENSGRLLPVFFSKCIYRCIERLLILRAFDTLFKGCCLHISIALFHKA